MLKISTLLPGTFIFHYKNPSKLYTYLGFSKISSEPIKKEFFIANCFKCDNDDQIFKLFYNKEYKIITNDIFFNFDDTLYALYRSHSDRRIWVRPQKSFEDILTDKGPRFSIYKTD